VGAVWAAGSAMLPPGVSAHSVAATIAGGLDRQMGVSGEIAARV
jgi:hypothetical protein